MKTVGLIGLMPFAVWIAVGCNGTGGTTATSSELVSQAVAQATSTHSAAVSCFDDFQTCIDAASGTTAPDLCKAAEDRPDCDGGMDRHGGPGGAGGPPPSPGPGGMGPGGPHGGADDGHGGHDGPPPPPLSPAGRVALATCHAELHKCLSAATDASSCVATEHCCVHDAIAADFATLCASISTQCAACPDSPPCADLTARCAAGLSFGDLPDGGPAVAP